MSNLSTKTKAPAKKSRSRDADGHVGGSQSAVRSVQGVPDNLTIQRLLSERAILAKLEIAAPNDPLEREADRVAEKVMRCKDPLSCGGICGGCWAGNEEVVRRREDDSHGSPPATAGADILGRLGAGRPLDAETRGYFETRLHHDFADTRIHAGDAAAAAAASINARAFSLGREIVFGRGQYSPYTAEGKKLLAHELVHGMQAGRDAKRVFRNGDQVDAASGDPAQFDPCAVVVEDLTNAAFVRTMARTREYLARTKRGEGDYFDYAHLWERLETDRGRRVRLGHGWLTHDLSSVPRDLYQLIPGSGLTVHVAWAETAEESGPPFSHSGALVMTRSQFEEFMAEKHVEPFDVNEMLAMQEASGKQSYPFQLPPPPVQPPQAASLWPPYNPLAPVDPLSLLAGPGAYGAGPSMFTSPYGFPFAPLAGQGPGGVVSAYDPFAPQVGSVAAIGGSFYQPVPGDVSLSPYLARDIYSPGLDLSNPNVVRGAETNWRGNLAEGLAQEHLSATQLNDLMPNMRVWDLMTPEGRPVSVTMSVTASGEPNLDWYVEKARRATGDVQPGKFGRAVQDLQSLGYGFTVDTATGGSLLVIPENHVAAAQRRWSIDIQNNPASNLRALDSYLRANPVQIGSHTVTSWSQLESLRQVDINSATQAELMRLPGIGPELSQRIVNERTRNGSFNSVDDLRRVRGIGDVTVEGLREVAGTDPVLPDQEFRAIRERLANNIATEKMRGFGRSSAEAVNFQQFRRDTSGVGPTEMARFQQKVPESFELVRLTGELGSRGAALHTLSHQPAMSGMKVGAAIGGAASLIQVIYDPKSHSWIEVPLDVTLGGAGGYAGTYLETAITARTGQAMMGAASRMPALAGPLSVAAPGARILGGGIAGGVTAPAVTMLSMAATEMFTEKDFIYIDYAAMAARTSVSGAVGGAAGAGAGLLTTALISGAGGSWGGPVGFLVGMGVGALAYWLTDKAVGKDIETSVRRALGEYGCTGKKPRPPAASQPVPPPPLFMCFVAGTRVLMHDGEEKAIEAVSEGDEVAAFDEVTGELSHGTVERLHQHGPSPYLRVELENGRSVGVTGAHRFFADGRWISAEHLKPGGRCLCLDPATQQLGWVGILAIERQPTARNVYNLTVSRWSTFIAEGTVVHNVKP